MTIQEEQLTTALIEHVRIFLLRHLLIISFGRKGAEVFHSLLVLPERVEVILESVDSLLKLVLLEDDLPELPLAVLTRVLFWVELARFEILKRLVGDGLSEVDVFELSIELVDPDVNEIIDLHAWGHEA